MANGVAIEPFEPGALLRYGVLVDAMLGTGLGGEVRAPYDQAIADVNDLGMPVLAVDIPSGLCADTGRVLGNAVRADLTVSFIGLKRGLLYCGRPDYAGAIEFSEPRCARRSLPGGAQGGAVDSTWQRCWSSSPCARRSPIRALMARCWWSVVITVWRARLRWPREAALRSGAGLVRVATRPEHVAALVARTPELMARGVSSGLELMPLVDAADVLVVGPGLGQSPWSEQLLQVAAESGKPMVLDADGLNLLAQGRVVATGGA